MARITRIAITIGVVLASFAVYARVVVPLVEPSVQRYAGTTPTNGVGPVADSSGLEGLFPVGAWELDEKRTKKLENDRIILLLQDYQTSDAGKVTIHPCTMIFLPDASVTDPQERKRRTVVLQAPAGAELEFDEPLELGLSRFSGHLTSGQLIGDVRIRSEGKLPGPEDDLMILARDVMITEQLVSTPNTVSFQLGPNRGRGRGMSIKLLANDKDQAADSSGPNLAGIEWFEIRHIEKLLIVADSDDVADAGASAQSSDSNVPIEVTCDGPFRFDAIAQAATFSDNVVVLCLRREGIVQINCSQLAIEFARHRDDLSSPSQPTTAPQERKQKNTFDLQVRRIVAEGDPVVVSAPEDGVTAEGEWLSYDLQEELISLARGSEVFLRQDSDEIHAKNLQYKLGPKGRIGQVRAEGPGWIFARTSSDSDQALHARWNGLLQVNPDQGKQLLSLDGNVVLDIRGFGRLDAQEIKFWMFETLQEGQDPSEQEYELSPDRMQVTGQVRLKSDELSTYRDRPIDSLKIWFKQEGSAIVHGTLAVAAPGLANSMDPQPATAVQQDTQQETESPSHHFQVAGDSVLAEILLRGDGEKPQLVELTIEHGFLVEETRTAQPDERPVVVRGEQFSVTNANTPHATATLIGLPAHFEARGISADGTNIHLDQGANTLSINGAGSMGFPVTKDLEGNPISPPGVMTVEWQGGMKFDGLTATFDETVVVKGPGQYLDVTDRLEVTLVERIDFADADINLDGADSNAADRPDPEIARIDCHGKVYMENRVYDELSQLKSFTRGRVVNLGLNVLTGEANADGPGRITSVRPAKKDEDRFSLGSRNASNGEQQNRLEYLDIQFQSELVGLSLPYRVTFYDQVHCVYGKVDAWEATLDPDDPSFAQAAGAELHCDELSVDDARRSPKDKPIVNLLASGNVLAEGQGYTARASRMTYAQAKDQLILEGTGYALAELYRENSRAVVAQKFFFWPETKDFQIDGAQSAELSSPSFD